MFILGLSNYPQCKPLYPAHVMSKMFYKDKWYIVHYVKNRKPNELNNLGIYLSKSKSKTKQNDFYEKSKFESINFGICFLIFKVGGLVSQGIITEGMSLNLGPFEDGTFRSEVVTSIKRNRAACRLVRATLWPRLPIVLHKLADRGPGFS